VPPCHICGISGTLGDLSIYQKSPLLFVTKSCSFCDLPSTTLVPLIHPSSSSYTTDGNKIIAAAFFCNHVSSAMVRSSLVRCSTQAQEPTGLSMDSLYEKFGPACTVIIVYRKMFLRVQWWGENVSMSYMHCF
jgi:hypothetical protein